MRSLLKILFIVTLLELFIAGGGRVFEIGPITLRIVLFFLNIGITSFLYIHRERFPKYIIALSSVAAVALITHSLIGLVNGAAVAAILEDIKPLFYFFSILFFSYYVDRTERVYVIVSLLKKSSLFLALAYLCIQILFFLGRLDFLWFYSFANTHISPSDFIFRGTEGLFFYKGFIYMVVGLIFWIHSESSFTKNVAVLIIITAMILTGTRGFILMFGVVYALFYGIPFLLKLNWKFLVLALILITGSIYFFGNFEIGDKALSDSIRIQQLTQVFQDIGPISLFIGHGFGVGIPVRPVHMEVAYLEVFHKQGLVGLLLWGGFFMVLYNAYVLQTNYANIRKAFLIGICFVLLVSFTNPIFNNPIGISLFMIALSVFTVLNKAAIQTESTEPKLGIQ